MCILHQLHQTSRVSDGPGSTVLGWATFSLLDLGTATRQGGTGEHSTGFWAEIAVKFPSTYVCPSPQIPPPVPLRQLNSMLKKEINDFLWSANLTQICLGFWCPLLSPGRQYITVWDSVEPHSVFWLSDVFVSV